MIEAIDDGIVCDPDTTRRYHQTIRSEIHHLTALLDDLFELSRIESGALTLNCERMNIEDMISDALESSREQAEQAQVRVIGRVEDRLPAVNIDARQIYRALMNLLQNAMRYTPAGGSILIYAGPTSALPGSSEDGAILVQVIDTGEGVSAEDLPHIFDRTYRGESSRRRIHSQPSVAASTSAGLGLAIARGIIEAHGQRIWAESPLSQQTLNLVTDRSSRDLRVTGTALNFTVPVAASDD
jgi:signal transduction histidine kinase